jgi:hypothetical protein
MNFKEFEDGLQVEIEISGKTPNHGIKRVWNSFFKAPLQKSS